MGTITFHPTTTTQYVNWGDSSIWSPAVVPNEFDADVVTPVVYLGQSPYTYYINVEVGSAYDIHSLDLQNDYLLVNGQLSVDGDINAGVSGAIDVNGVLSASGTLNAATVNDGTIQAGLLYLFHNSFSTPAYLVVSAQVTGRGHFQIDAVTETFDFEHGATRAVAGTLELEGPQSQDVVFAEGAGTLRLDAPDSYTGSIVVDSFLMENTATNTDYTNYYFSSFNVELAGIAYNSMTGYSYDGDASSGNLNINTNSGTYSLHFIGNLQSSDFKLSGGSTFLDVTVTPAPPAITGAVANQTTTSEAPVHPFSGVTISDLGGTESLTITVGGAGGALSGAGLVGGTKGVYTLSGIANAITSKLDALIFTPNAGNPGSTSMTTFTLSDVSSAYAIPTATPKPAWSTSTRQSRRGSRERSPTRRRHLRRRSSVLRRDDQRCESGAADVLTITVGGAGGALSGAGLVGGTNGVYTLSGKANAITSKLDALIFTPNAGNLNSISRTEFTLSDVSSAYAAPTVDSKTSVFDVDPAIAPRIAGTLANQTTTSEAPVHPFSGVTITDPNSGATDVLTITVGGAAAR